MGGIPPARAVLLSAVAAAGFIAALLVLLTALSACPVRAQQAYLEFLPPRFEGASYAPGDTGVIILTFRNALPATPLELVNATVHFDWNASIFTDFGPLQDILAPDENRDVHLPFPVPSDAFEGTHTYSVEVAFAFEVLGVPVTTANSWGPFDNLRIAGGGWPLVVWVSFAAVLGSAALVGFALLVQRRRPSGLELGRIFRTAREAGRSEEPPPGVVRARAGAPVALEAGAVYLFEERKPRLAFEAVREAQQKGHRATLIVAREAPDRLERLHGLQAEETLWLTYSHEPPAVDPTGIGAITGRVYRFLEPRPNALLLFEGLEYLITQNNFHTVLRFLSHIRDAVLRKGASLVLVADPRVLSLSERALLERDAHIVVPEDEPEEPSAAPPAPPTRGAEEAPAG